MIRRASARVPVLSGLILLALTAAAPAAWSGDRWSVSFGLGSHLPGLEPLNNGLLKAPMIGTATILVREGGVTTAGSGQQVDQNETTVFPFRYNNPVPDFGPTPYGSIELRWHPNERHSFVFGMGSMESLASNITTDHLPVQQHFASNLVMSERRDKISYTEYTIGWNYNFRTREKYRLYTRLSLHEVFDIDFREDFVFLFVQSPITDLIGIRRDMVVEAQTASLLMGQLGMGGEWFLTDWLSFGLEGGYLFGERSFKLRDVKTFDDFVDGDSVTRTGMPYTKLSDGTLGYLAPGTTADNLANPDTRESYYRPMNLRFDGWRMVFRVNLYF